MPSKKKKYNARFPAGRIKKIMQTDEEVGKVAQAVPVIISRTLELFVESLLKRTVEITNARNARTLTPSHMKQCILSESRFDFLADLVKNIPDSVNDEDVHTELAPNPTSSASVSRRRSSVESSKQHPTSSSSASGGASSSGSGCSVSTSSNQKCQQSFVSSSTHCSFSSKPQPRLLSYPNSSQCQQAPTSQVQNEPYAPQFYQPSPSSFEASSSFDCGAASNNFTNNTAHQYDRHPLPVSEQHAQYEAAPSLPPSQSAQSFQPPSAHVLVPSENNSGAAGFHFNLLPAPGTANPITFNTMVPSYAPSTSSFSSSNLVIDEDYDN